MKCANEAQTSDVHRAVVPLSTMHYDPARNVLCTRDHCFAERPLGSSHIRIRRIFGSSWRERFHTQ